MPQAELLSRLDAAIDQAPAFSPVFLELHKLRLDIATATAETDAADELEQAFQDWQAEQEYRETCLWANY